MTDTFSSILTCLGLPMQLFVLLIPYALRLERRNRSLWLPLLCYLLFGVAAFLLWFAAGSYLLPFRSRMVISILYSIISYVSAYLMATVWCRISALEALYAATCAYLGQHFTYCLCTLFFPSDSERLLFGGNVFCLAVFTACFLAEWFFFAKHLVEDGHFEIEGKRAVLPIVFAIGCSLVLSALAQNAPQENRYFRSLVMIYAMVCCFYILWEQVGQKRSRSLERALSMKDRIYEENRKQYAVAQENVDLINRKCHDLKHQIAALKHISDRKEREESIRSLEDAVMIYDSIVETGNEILNTILTEKSLLCESKQINMTCIADGGALQFVSAVDLYTILGNAVDNAIEAVSALPMPEDRCISLIIKEKAGMVLIQTENPYQLSNFGQSENSEHSESSGQSASPFHAKNPAGKTADYLPPTSKQYEQGWHGYGLKSIRFTAEKYGGQMEVHSEGGIFVLRVILPVPKA